MISHKARGDERVQQVLAEQRASKIATRPELHKCWSVTFV